MEEIEKKLLKNYEEERIESHYMRVADPYNKVSRVDPIQS